MADQKNLDAPPPAVIVPPAPPTSFAEPKQQTPDPMSLREYCAGHGISPYILLPYIGGGDIDAPIDFDKLTAAHAATKAGH